MSGEAPVVIPWERRGHEVGPTPTVVLVGDSIRMGYAPLVAERLRGVVRIVAGAENGGDSARVLANLDEGVLAHRPDLVHLNCGLHDLKRAKSDGAYQVRLERYVANLGEIVARVRGAGVPLVFASTTPIHNARHSGRGAAFDRAEEDVRRYNVGALAVMREMDVPVHDLHGLVVGAGSEVALREDGTHFTPEGNGMLAEAVADCVRRHLTVLRLPRSAAPASGPDVTKAYRENEARRDAAVPEVYRRVSAPELELPGDAEEWRARRQGLLETVMGTLGTLPARPAPQRSRVVSRELRGGYTLERVAIWNGVDQEIGALVLVPDGLKEPAPSVMWLHSSTPDKNQVITPNTYGGEEPFGEALVRRGYVVLAPDAYWHGERAGAGPAGPFETWREEQESLFKMHLWLGRTLWGMFVRDDQIALDYLCARREVDASRIGVTGMSMGSTRAWWLAALDERIRATVATACLTRYQNLIKHGQLRQHGMYYFVDGLLQHFDVEAVLALIAPRPLLALTGELDAGSPADGVRELERAVAPVYATLSGADRFRSVIYPGTGHTVTPEMRAETVAWFDRWLAATS